jgi:cellulose synthase/poly-beta-1,6-N-acetylglucosamine synthase-like glycosyltransferase/peptidoglycan/xylan/chitin deacetylase (PgdA/CDA1 family)/spore germination protein YaaH
MTQHIFADPTGRRWRAVRRTVLALGVFTTLATLVLVAYLLVPPAFPQFSQGILTNRRIAQLPTYRGTRSARERATERRRLMSSLEQRPRVPALRPSAIPIHAVKSERPIASAGAEFAAFYVNWDDNAFASLREHAQDIDWLVAEWAFVTKGGDSLQIRVDRRVPFLLSTIPAGNRPRILAMISNFDSLSQRFDARRIASLVGHEQSRRRAAQQIALVVREWGLAGVSLDFEEIPDALHPQVRTFLKELRIALNAVQGTGPPLIVSMSVSADIEPAVLTQYAALNDRIFLMLYDEHYGKGDPGPVASQGWYEQRAEQLLKAMPPDKAILAIGAYGYDWNDAGPLASGDALTFQEVMGHARDDSASVHFDSVSLNPYIKWSDDDGTDHVAWYLDAVTAYNQLIAARRLGARGNALWRLGAEDPSLWRALRTGGLDDGGAALDTIPPGYDVQFNGEGELLRIGSRPTVGDRSVGYDSLRGLITKESVAVVPTPWIVERFGAQPHRVALTFDDGPDKDWTPAILDTLASRHAPGTFFMIGTAVESNIRLARRVLAAGNEVGNHTFTHPNMSLLSPRLMRFEMDFNERLLEAALDRRILFFRAPYFGDAEPTTADELIPAGIASDRGYIIAGLHLDSEDWQRPGVNAIVRNVLEARSHGNVVLLHDGGGDRSQTLAAIGPLIDSLRARGDTLVPLSALAGDGKLVAMPPLLPADEATRLSELAGFATIGAIEWVMTWLFLIAVVLGLGRVAFVGILAIVQRSREILQQRRAAKLALTSPAPPPYLPAVTVIVPAFREETVIVRTVQSLLAQQYGGTLEVVVVDDGSPDDTYAVARDAFEGDTRVTVLTKANGGKSSALNFGITHAHGEIVIGLDADTLFETNTVAELVKPLARPEVVAVAGNAKVGNRLNLITRWQAIEYVTSQNLDRRAFSLLNGITVVPGAVGAWRRDAVAKVGGFSLDTLAEDQDLTLTLLAEGYHVAYAPHAIAWTEAPDTVKGLLKQRFRWSFGTLQCMWKHRNILLRPRYGTLGMIALPNTWIFQLIVNAIAPLADLMFVWSLISVWLVGLQHGSTYAVASLEQILTLYALFLLVDWLAAVIAFLAEPGEQLRLTWLVFIQRFAYRQFMYWVVLRAFIAAARGGLVGWGKLDRKATVQLRQS